MMAAGKYDDITNLYKRSRDNLETRHAELMNGVDGTFHDGWAYCRCSIATELRRRIGIEHLLRRTCTRCQTEFEISPRIRQWAQEHKKDLNNWPKICMSCVVDVIDSWNDDDDDDEKNEPNRNREESHRGK